VHLALIDVLYESQGQVLFNELPGDSVESRFYTEDLLMSHVSQDLYVTSGGGKKVSQKAMGAADIIADVRKVFLVNQQDKAPHVFNNTQRYFINSSTEQLRDLL